MEAAMTREITLAAAQFACSWDIEANLKTAERLVREAAGRGAQVVLLQEFFRTPYFCLTQDPRHVDLAHPVADDPAIARFRRVAAELGVVVPVSFFERAGQAFFNSVAVIDADGSVLGVYRKSHIPDAVGYQEKFYFSPGDTGFRVWDTRHGRLGVGICWDQWFPESARCMALMGAEVVLYPTAIGSDPPLPASDSREAWQLAQRGHAVANSIPVVAANRVGLETAPVRAPGEAGGGDEIGIRFYGSSFIAGPDGSLLAAASRDREEVIKATVDLDALRRRREEWAFFRDRRPELYRPLLTLDGQS
jgi:N-carbamoylputrescine amidase